MGKKIQKKILGITLLVLFSACSDVGLLETIEDAESLSDGSLSNNVFVHSMVRVGNDNNVYLGSKNLWVKKDSTKDWSVVKIPSVDTNKNPVVSVATDGTDLFVATSNNVYRRAGGTWSAIRPGDYTFYALHGASNVTGSITIGTILLSTESDGVLYYDKTYDDKTNTWKNVTDASGNVQSISDFAFVKGAGSHGAYYVAVGTSLKKYDLFAISTPNKHSYTEVTQTAGKNITSLLPFDDNSNGVEDKLGILAGGDFFVHDPNADSATNPNAFIAKGGNSATNISLIQVGNRIVFGRVQAGYQIFTLPYNTGQWSSSPATDGFTDNDSLALLSTGDSLMGLSLGVLLYYDNPDDSKDRLYAGTLGSRGLFGAKLKNGLWSWGQE